MKIKSLSLALFLLLVASTPAFSKAKNSNSKKPAQTQKSEKSGGIASDSFLHKGAWDWSNWQDVVADCELYRFRSKMISSK